MPLRHNVPALSGWPAPVVRLLHRLLVMLLMAGTVPALAGEGPDPQVSVQLSETRPYVQQTVILRLRVSHSTAVTGLDVEAVQARDFILEELTGPPQTTRQSGPQQMTSDFVYALTPLTSGTLDLPPLQVHVAQDGTATDGAQAVPQVLSPGSEPPGLEVQALPRDTDAQLPLYALEVALRFDPRQRLQVGQPFEVSIVQQAAGAAGERLSDATALLKHPDFRLYPGQSRTSSRLSRNGQRLQGQRIDTLTLVPLRDGQLQLPAITLPWWDVTRGTAAQASWPEMPVQVRPEPGSVAAQPTVSPPGPGSGVALWQVIIGTVLAFAAGWWLRGRRGETAAGGRQPRWSGLLHGLRRRFVAAWQRRPVRQRSSSGRAGRRATGGMPGMALRRPIAGVGRFAAQLPKPLVPWLETARLRKHVEEATDVAALRQCLLAWGSEVLGLPTHTPLMELGRTLVKAYPQVDGARLSRLLAELDASLYGAALAPNLGVWKQAFGDELGHVGMHKPFRVSPQRHHQGLPVLNPG